MLANAFIGKTQAPTARDLAAELGETKVLWDQLVADMTAEQTIDVQEWNSYSPKYGWSLRLKHRKRTIIYMVPYHGAFSVAFILGGRAVEAACKSKLPARVIKIIEEGKQYPEGREVRIQVKGVRDLPAIIKLAAIKLEN